VTKLSEYSFQSDSIEKQLHCLRIRWLGCEQADLCLHQTLSRYRISTQCYLKIGVRNLPDERNQSEATDESLRDFGSTVPLADISHRAKYLAPRNS
jgi:hypothetical protein